MWQNASSKKKKHIVFILVLPLSMQKINRQYYFALTSQNKFNFEQQKIKTSSCNLRKSQTKSLSD